MSALQTKELTHLHTEIPTMPGMENVHQEIMLPFGMRGASLIIDQLQEGKNIVVGCFLNGGILPVAQTIAQLRRDLYDGRIDRKLFDSAMNSVTLYERVREKKSGTDTKQTVATLEHPDRQGSPDTVLNFDDIIETLETTDDLHETYPDADIIVAAAVKKHKTNPVLEEKGYTAHCIREVDDRWIFSSCGMDGSNSYIEAIAPYQAAQLSVLQRASNVGTYKIGEGPVSYRQQYDYFGRHNRLLPWITQLCSYDQFGNSPHDQGVLNDLVDLELAKMQKDYTTQMQLGYSILQNFAQLDDADIIKMTTRRSI